MRYRDDTRPPGGPGAEQPAAAVITECPFCRSNRVATTNKTLSESTYWRCGACGEIWNPSRAMAAPRRRIDAW